MDLVQAYTLLLHSIFVLLLLKEPRYSTPEKIVGIGLNLALFAPIIGRIFNLI